MDPVVIDGVVYVPSVQADGNPSGDWLPLVNYGDLFLEETA
jgi:hypothetical protein